MEVLITCKLCKKEKAEYIIPYLTCKYCWADYIINETNVLPYLSNVERQKWIENLVNPKK